MTPAAAPRSSRLFWLLHSAGWSGVFLLSYLSGLALDQPVSYWKISLPLAAAGFLVTLGLRHILRRLADEPPRRLIALMIGPVLAACLVMALVYMFALSTWCTEYQPRRTLGYVSYIATTLYIVMTWVGLYIGIKYQQRLRQQTEAALAASAAAHQAQLRMLRYQLNPHFLFNTLNAISTLVLDRDTAGADRMVHRLSAFLCHSLDNDPELKLSRSYRGLSAALHERITIDGGRAAETNFHAYPLLRLHEAPARIDVHFVDRPDAQISGLGESALPPVAPALANALYRATGHRLRELPLKLPA